MEALPKTGNRARKTRPRFRRRPLYGKTGSAGLMETGRPLRWPCPAPPASFKEQNQGRMLSGRKALSTGTWNSGRSGAKEHMPRKPIDKSRSPTLTRRGCRSFERQPLPHGEWGEFQRGNASEHSAALRARLARSDYRSTSFFLRSAGRSASSFSGGLRKTEARKSFTNRGACFTASRNSFVSSMSRSQRDL